MALFTPLGQPLFDAWSLAHLGFWFVFASSLWAFFKARARLQQFIVCITLAFVWELFEVFAEQWWPHIWRSPESLLNRWIGDPLACVIGTLFIWWALDASARRSP